ncbi:hypothetical protein WICPIJ_008727 [Wickerhamomyces pijperi]|uniref:Uncharacterized protein n=1 Tax=Wickerhamomyces pijperi TaxID=599730 RepID=A0A9P8PXI5_WICPI|nr:hypothetical protein WICPIJ_008727 [Wickerhamomyces pijperi]
MAVFNPLDSISTIPAMVFWNCSIVQPATREINNLPSNEPMFDKTDSVMYGFNPITMISDSATALWLYSASKETSNGISLSWYLAFNKLALVSDLTHAMIFDGPLIGFSLQER